MVDETRDDLIDDLKPEELKVEKAKLKKEGDEEHLKQVEEEQWEDSQEDAVKDNDKFNKNRNEAMIVEDRVEGLAAGEEADDAYDKEERKDLVENDELESQEAGFLEGYERDSDKPKKEEPKSDEERL